MKRKIPFFYVLFGLMACGGLFFNSSSGQTGRYAGAPGDSAGACLNCHSYSTTSTVNPTEVLPSGLTLTGAPANFTAGISYPLTLTLKHSTGVRGGFQIVATSTAAGNNVQYGTFVAGTGSKLVTTASGLGRLIHSSAKAFTSGSVSWTFNWTAPATGSGVKFYFAGNASDFNGDETTNDVIYTSSQLSTIPVELMSFDGKLAEKGVNLTWKTASERNNRVFEIERKVGNVAKEFEKIGEVKGLSNTFGISTYDFVDNAPQADKVNYYCLRQVDFDGTATYSKVISIGVSAANKAFKVYPNFVSRGLDIQIETENSAAATFDIVDIHGKILQSIKKAAYTEGSLVSTTNLPTGQYFVRSTGSLIPQTNTFIVF
jgi:hypothetical protein